ncbi:MAG TPA: hypothetical protein GX715_20280 [Armatimonadetes bacterium]|nr:hypothetical protein [Armatimonadota bacterium]
MRTATFLAFVLFMLPVAVLAQEGGPVTIGGIRYERVDPGEPFQERPAPKPDWQPAAPTRAERAAGLLAYVTSDPGDYRPDGVPRPEEHARELSAFLTPGEDEPVWVGARALESLKGLAIRVDLAGAPVTCDVRHMHFWPQRTGWRSRQWYITPELLLPCADGRKMVPTTRGLLEERSFDLAAEETAAFWLTLSARADARPGVYTARVTLQAAGKPALELPLHIEVLPFQLQRPEDRAWLLYADAGRWRTMSDSQVMAELRDFARHGITGLVEGSLGTADLSGLKEGRVVFDASSYKKLAAQCLEAGIPGPHVCSMGGWPQRVRDALGLKVDLEKGTWPEEIRAGVTAVAKAAVEATKDAPAPWLFYGRDEPSGDDTYAIQDYQCWRAGGAETYATFYQIGFLEKASEYLTAPCFVSGLVANEETARKAREECARTGAEFWWYGTGCYVNPFPQEGYMFHNRYGAGLLFWKTGAKAQVSWTFCRPHEDVFNDFDGARVNHREPKEQATVYPHFLKPDDWSTYQGAIPTIAWEALREGVDDYRYLHTLAQTIAEARAHRDERVRAAAREAQEMLDALVNAVPWANPLGKVAFETRRMQQVRRAAADQIIRLRTALTGKPVAKRRQDLSQVTLVVRATEGVTAQAAPAIAVLPTTVPPVIDGDLSDPCWTESAVATNFYRANDGGKPEVDTEARILYDARALYVSFRCPEPAMAKLRAARRGHDTPEVWLDDGIEFFVAGGPRAPYAHLIVNTNGAVYDERNQDPSWNSSAEVRVRKEANAYCVEIALPWSDLEKAGIRRSPVMAVNFCRSRFAGPEKDRLSAWSCTYGGFHVPDRFGWALVQEGSLALQSLTLPRFWGKQSVEVVLRNRGEAPAEARLALENQARSLRLAPGASGTARFPLTLRQPGSSELRLAWSTSERPASEITLPITVPEPAILPRAGGLASAGETLELPVAVHLAAGERKGYRIRIEAGPEGSARRVEIPATPGAQKRVRLKTHGPIRLRASLVDRGGVPVGESVEQMVVVLP